MNNPIGARYVTEHSEKEKNALEKFDYWPSQTYAKHFLCSAFFLFFLEYVPGDSKKNNCRKKIPGKVRMKYIFFKIIICLSINNLYKFIP